jgi:hypothetical protein
MEFSGRLAAFPIGDILQWTHNDRRSGALVVRRSAVEKRIFLREGEVVACFSDDAAEFFGQHLLVNGLLEEPKLIRALTHCQKQGGLLGQALEALGLLSADAVAAAIERHVRDQVCDIFLWRTGVFYFTTEALPNEQLLPRPIPAVQLAMEGSRWADELQRIRRVFVHDNIVLKRSGKSAETPNPLERRILRAADGKMPLSELYGEVRGSFFRFLEAAYQLAVREALDVVSVGDQTDTASTELRLADLLIEQVTEEQTVFLRHHLAVPYDALERCVPVWVRRPDATEEARMPPPVREFYARIDGEADFATLLSGADNEERVRRMERLVLQLRKGTIALLPGPASELESRAGEPARRKVAPGSPGHESWWRRLIP